MTRQETLARFPSASEATIRANLSTPLPGAATLPHEPLAVIAGYADRPLPLFIHDRNEDGGLCRACGARLKGRSRQSNHARVHEREQRAYRCTKYDRRTGRPDVEFFLQPNTKLTAPAATPAPKHPRVFRVAKTRNGATLTEAAFWGMVRSGLRRTFRWWKPALAALKAARVPFRGPRGQRWAFLCADCQKLFLRRQVQIDHVVPAGALTDYAHVGEFLRRLTPEGADAFRVRCTKCHQKKTNAERTGR